MTDTLALQARFKLWFDSEEITNGCMGTSQLERDQMFMAWLAAKTQKCESVINRDDIVKLLLQWWTREIDDSTYWNRMATLLNVTNDEFLASGQKL